MAALALCAALFPAACSHSNEQFSQQTYRIGWQTSPPYQLMGKDGKPTGLAVDLVREAARRRGIKLDWVNWQNASESALQTHKVDMWPLITITPARLKALHITEPYMEAEHTLLVRGDSSFQNAQDLKTSPIALANTSIDSILLHGFLPDAVPLNLFTPRRAIDDVCNQGGADAVFMDVYTAIAALLAQPGCQSHSLRWIPVPGALTQLGIGATFEASAAADAIRAEIGIMAREGDVAPIIGKWGFTPAQNLVSLGALVDAKRRVARLAAATTMFALLFILASWQTILLIRERNRAKRTEKALREANQKVLLMANNLKEMVLAYGMDRKLIYANPAVQTLTGYSLADYTARGFIDWIHPDHQARMMDHWDRLFLGSSFENEEYLLITKGGEVKWVSATWGPILDDRGRQVGVQGSERDITDRKRAEEELRESQLRNMQSQKMEGIGRLAGGVAHDFNNLLTVINGYAELLLLNAGPNTPESEQLEQIRQAGTRAADLTKQLLAFSRRQVMNLQPLDLNAVVISCQTMFQRMLGEEVQLIVRPQSSLGLVMADAGQMHQVLMNLLVNARDAMPGGGKVLVTTSNVEIGAAYVADHPEATAGAAVMLEVTDGGLGMDDETQKNIFEPFFTTKAVGAGTGLGLATVYGIVNQSQGWIVFDSEAGKGTRFQVYLPRIQGHAAEEPAAKSGAEQLGGCETVLVVEDQDEVRVFAAGVLESFGYTVLTAADGPRALSLAAGYEGPIHLLLTDVVMPGMNGRQLADSLTALRPQMRVIYTSGYTEEIIAHRGVLDADVTYLAKPYSPEDLGTRLRDAMGR